MAIGEELPEDVLMDILSHLTVKSLLRFRSVSKYWFSLIQSPRFVALHRLRNAADTNNECLLVRRFLITPPAEAASALEEATAAKRFDPGSIPKRRDLVLSLVPNETLVHDLDVSSVLRGRNANDFLLWASSNGLVCLLRYPDIVICNPAMREFRLLPDSPCHTWRMTHLGFGFDPKSNDYKVVRVTTLYESDIRSFAEFDCPFEQEFQREVAGYRIVDEKVHIYQLSTDSWREVRTVVPKDLLCDNYRTSLNGVFYWYAKRCNSPLPWGAIVGFRMSDEVFEQVPVPDIDFFRYICNLCTLKDSLALVIQTDSWGELDQRERHSCFEIWVMDEYGMKESWTIKYTIGPFLGGFHFPEGIRKNGDFFLVRCGVGQMFSYNITTLEIKEYQVYDKPGWILVPRLELLAYIECLISVKRHVD